MHDRARRLKRWCLVATLVGFAGSATAQDTQRWTLKRLREAYREAYDSAEYDRAIELLLELERKRPERPEQAYDLACLYSLTGQKDEAVNWLRLSSELGFAGHRLVTFDDDLANIRARPEFAEVADKIAESYKKALAAFKEEAGDPNPVVILPPHRDTHEPVPLIVALHGYGGEAPEMADAWREAAANLEEFGTSVRLVVYKNTAHHFPPDRIGATREALKYVLADD